MADLKISQLPAATTPVAGTEVLPIVQSATTKKVSIADLTDGRSITTAGASLDGAVVINDSGADVDFRIEGDTDANLFFVDASTDNVGIGTASPGAKLSVDGSAIFNESGADVDFRVESDTNTHALFVDAGNSRVGVNTNSPAVAFQVSGDVRFETLYRSNFGLNLATTDELVIAVAMSTFDANALRFMASFGSGSETTRRGFVVDIITGYAAAPTVGTATVSANYNVTSSGFSAVRLSNNTYEFIIKHQGSLAYTDVYSAFSIQGTKKFTVTSITARTKT